MSKLSALVVIATLHCSLYLLMFTSFKTFHSSVRRRIRPLSTSTLPIVELLQGKERKFLEGNPIVYDGAIRSIKGKPEAGDEVYVADHSSKIFGKGLFNPHSMYRVRMLALATEPEFSMSFEELLHSRIDSAIDNRAAIGLPSSSTNTYRLVNGEGDRLGGLAVDVIGKAIIAQPSALWVERHSSIVKKVLGSYAKANDMSLIWRRQANHLKQDGFNASTPDMDDIGSVGSVDNSIISENGIRFFVDASADQKTGFYCDQRDNRQLIRKYCQDKNVLDLYCYTGGFALNCIAGGAKSVLAVDSSQRAIEAAQKNRLLNGMENALIEFHEGDCEAVMKAMVGSRCFDVIVCDPPKLAPSRKNLSAASKKYRVLNTLAMQLIEPKGGLLLSCSCSAAMTQSNTFLDVLRDAAMIAGRKLTILEVRGAAADHPVLPVYPEGKYLTAVLMKVE